MWLSNHNNDTNHDIDSNDDDNTAVVDDDMEEYNLYNMSFLR